MNRIKHLTMLILKIVFIILCFVLASAMSALQSIPLNETEHLKSHTGLKECTVQFNESDFAETGASASYEIVGSDIVFHITQSGDRYDDIKATVTLPAITYDSSPMRDYLYDILGDKAEREEEYLTAIEEGPWKSELYFSMECNTEDPGYFARSYTLMDPASIEYSEPAEKSGEGSTVYTESFGAEKGKDITFTLTFGTSERGALPSGTYTFSGFVEAAGLYGEDAPKISFLSSVNILTSVASRSAKEKGLSVFSVENWLVFYGVMIMFGQFIYLWRDLRAMSKIYGAIMEAGGETFEVIVTTYVNGCYSGQHTELRGGGSPLVALLISVLCFMVFMLTIPIRIIIYIIRDIVFLFKEDYDLDGFSYTGNILGSVGIYVLLFGIVALIGQSTVLGIICTVLGIAMCVVASILCKKKEEEFG